MFKWNLKSLSWIDYDDVAQIIRIHIHKKWHLYNQEKPIGPWLNTLISNQIKNLIRNNYANLSKPCYRCDAAEGEDLCVIYEYEILVNYLLHLSGSLFVCLFVSCIHGSFEACGDNQIR